MDRVLLIRARRKVLLFGISIAISAVFLTFGLRLVLAVPGVLPGTLDIKYGEEEFDCLQAVLNDPATYDGLKDRLAYCALWHVSTTLEAEGFRHSFYFAAKKRNTSRLSCTSVTVTPQTGTGYSISEPSHGFAPMAVGGLPTAGDERGLEVLRAAFNQPRLRRYLLDGFGSHGLDIHSICVDTTGSEILLSFSSRSVEDDPPFVMSFAVRFKPNSGYKFYFD